MDEISFTGIHKHFPRRIVLEDVSIQLSRGSVMILSGDNGSGKTTLLRILAGLEKPHSGLVDFGGAPLEWSKSRGKLLEQVMYLHQHPYMFEGAVTHNLSLALPRSLSSQKKSERIREALEWGMLDHQANQQAKTLSGGQQQRLALARAWLRRPRFLLLDEPVSNMDSQSSARTVKLLQRLKTSGTSLLICSHNSRVFDSLSDRFLELVDGNLRTLEAMEYGSNVSFLDNNLSGSSAVGNRE